MVQLPEGVPLFIHINENDYSGQKHIKLNEEDIAICECHYDASDPGSGCGERCLNVLTSTECTPGYCPCGDLCKNQRFQKCEYAKTKLFKTDGRGWGLLADENIKAGTFIIEYCGEVISSEEAKLRSHSYEAQGLRDAYIISLDAHSFIDATRMGSLARFINHSCQPNCETRKWTVLGETRVGIFSKQDILAGTELAYDYNFEWYGGTAVRCLCGAPNCSIFLGAKSQGFQEYNHVWEDGDDRYTVEKIPLYDSAEDEPSAKLLKTSCSFEPFRANGANNFPSLTDGSLTSEHLESTVVTVEPLYSVPTEGVKVIDEIMETKPYSLGVQQAFPQMNPLMSRIRSNIGPGSASKRRRRLPNRKSKNSSRMQINFNNVAQLFASKEAQEEVLKYQEIRNQASSQLSSLYDEIRPAIEEHERDSQDSVNTSLAEKWIEATCFKWKADFDVYFSVVKNKLFTPQTVGTETEAKSFGGAADDTAVKSEN